MSNSEDVLSIARTNCPPYRIHRCCLPCVIACLPLSHSQSTLCLFFPSLPQSLILSQKKKKKSLFYALNLYFFLYLSKSFFRLSFSFFLYLSHAFSLLSLVGVCYHYCLSGHKFYLFIYLIYL